MTVSMTTYQQVTVIIYLMILLSSMVMVEIADDIGVVAKHLKDHRVANIIPIMDLNLLGLVVP